MGTITEHDVIYANDEKQIHYLAVGPVRGPLIIFLHGWVGTGITWKPQLDAFSAVGFRVVAPDMPGYGKSSAHRVLDHYCQEALVEGMMALLKDTGRDAAIWVGHDWGSGVASSVATQHPEAVKALITLAVPFRTIELGWDGFLPFVNRDVYPVDQYEYGQWDYWRHYEENFEGAVAWFEQNIEGFCKACLQPTTVPQDRFSAMTATVRIDGGWFGMSKPMPTDVLGPPMLDPVSFESFVMDMYETGFWSGCAYYKHNERNAAYNRNAPSGGRLSQPVLFVHAERDIVCDTKTSRLAEPARQVCRNLTEVTVDAGHFLHNEKPGEVNAAIFRFIVEELPSEWPGYWDSNYTKKRAVA